VQILFNAKKRRSEENAPIYARVLSAVCLLRPFASSRFIIFYVMLATVACAVAEDDFPAPIKDHVAVQPGEHPRLFFRKSQVEEIRKLAQTPEGKQIVDRLRLLLGGGESMPTEFNPNRGIQKDGAGDFHAKAPIGTTYTLYHAAGFGMLYQLTSEPKYADLAGQCVDLALEGQRDRDNRYSFLQPTGALRAGPSLSAIAMAYDLCYDAWPDEYRKKIALAIQNYDGGKGPKSNEALAEIALSPRHKPQSNHWGPQVGGAGLAIIAIYGDPGTDTPLLDKYLDSVRKNAVRGLTEGFGDGGYFWEHLGPSQIMSDTAFIPYLQAERVAMGMDFISPKVNAQWVSLRWVTDLVSVKGKAEFPLRHPSSYGTGEFWKMRDGLSRGGQFVQGMGALASDEQRRAMLWVYNNTVEPDAASRTFDTVSPYPHRAILALVNWPIGAEPVNPEKIVPKARRDTRHDWFVFRNRWQDADDTLVTVLLGARGDGATSPTIWGRGMKIDFPLKVAGARASYWKAEDDGGGVFSTNLRGGVGSFAVDYSGKSGAETLVIYTGPGAGTGAKDFKSASGTARITNHTTGERAWTVLTIQTNEPPKVEVKDDALQIGERKVRFDGEKVVLE
jgi:hypothetical protein